MRGSFRPNHRFNSEWFVVGEIEQGPGELIAPGECAERIITFVPDGLPTLIVGMQWTIFEGPQKAIGRGTILDLLDA